MSHERTYIMASSISKLTKAQLKQILYGVKPDGVERGLVGEIIKRFENKGFQLLGLQLLSPTQKILEKHYEDLSSKPFFPGLMKYMTSGPV
ncbi:nucleoside diphosphate kinase, partial [Podila epicladia]